MMQTFRTEGNYRSADRLSAAELRAAMASREILQSTALAFDTARQLRFEFGGIGTQLQQQHYVIIIRIGFYGFFPIFGIL